MSFAPYPSKASELEGALDRAEHLLSENAIGAVLVEPMPLQALLREQQASFAQSCVGLTMPVLFTGPGRHPGQVVGRSPFLHPVHLQGHADLIGNEVLVRIVAAHPNSLAGTLVQERLIA